MSTQVSSNVGEKILLQAESDTDSDFARDHDLIRMFVRSTSFSSYRYYLVCRM